MLHKNVSYFILTKNLYCKLLNLGKFSRPAGLVMRNNKQDQKNNSLYFLIQQYDHFSFQTFSGCVTQQLKSIKIRQKC